jgi:2,3-bisphosphoglycerate-independent phosphoglycerate mutase
MMTRPKPFVLMILDGWGLNSDSQSNAIAQAKTPNLDRLFQEYPHSQLKASGTAVGLMDGQMGDSNVGHLNLGAGRIIYQELVRINRAIETGEFFENPQLLAAMDKARGRALHLLGLLSPGGVHSHQEHLFALLKMAVARGVEEIYIHAFLDGRDVPPASAKADLQKLEEVLAKLGRGRIATVSGRYYAMDRDKRWERTEKAWRAMTKGQGQTANSSLEALSQSYAKDITDEFVVPTVILDGEGKPQGLVQEGDSMIFFNFRPDRARQLTRAFVDEDFAGFPRPDRPRVAFTCLAEYDATIQAPVAFAPQEIKNTLGEILSSHGLKQLRIAETEKYAHVTFFFNGGVEIANPGEDRKLIPSPKVATYDLKPQMSAFEVTEEVIRHIKAGSYDVIIMNYANLDMVGHTGMMDAAVSAVETVDSCVGQVVDAVLQEGGASLLTGDHGNADLMADPATGDPYTAHTLNPVPCIAIVPGERIKLSDGILADVAPTALQILGLKQPSQMTGKSLIKKEE